MGWLSAFDMDDRLALAATCFLFVRRSACSFLCTIYIASESSLFSLFFEDFVGQVSDKDTI